MINIECTPVPAYSIMFEGPSGGEVCEVYTGDQSTSEAGRSRVNG